MSHDPLICLVWVCRIIAAPTFSIAAKNLLFLTWKAISLHNREAKNTQADYGCPSGTTALVCNYYCISNL